jgi:hypothetical protein
LGQKVTEIQVSLSGDEALVLFELLSRFSEGKGLAIEHPSEERVLWDIACLLEKDLAEPLGKNWPKLLEIARKKVCDEINK